MGRKEHKKDFVADTGGWKRNVLESIRLLTGLLLSPVRWPQSWLGYGEELIVVAQKEVG